MEPLHAKLLLLLLLLLESYPLLLLGLPRLFLLSFVRARHKLVLVCKLVALGLSFPREHLVAGAQLVFLALFRGLEHAVNVLWLAVGGILLVGGSEGGLARVNGVVCAVVVVERGVLLSGFEGALFGFFGARGVADCCGVVCEGFGFLGGRCGRLAFLDPGFRGL